MSRIKRVEDRRVIVDGPEPVYEYRVVCSDGMFGPISARDYEHAESVAAAFTNAVEGAHYHTIERRAVGPWEAT